MKMSRTKRLLIESGAVGLVCAIAWAGVVRPKQVALASERATLASQLRSEQEITRSLGVDAESAEAQLRSVRERARSLDIALASGDELGAKLAMFEQIADEHGVQFISTDPRGRGLLLRNAKSVIDTRGHILRVKGNYPKIAAFVLDIERRTPLSFVISTRIVPQGMGEDAEVVAEVETTHIRSTFRLDDDEVKGAGA